MRALMWATLCGARSDARKMAIPYDALVQAFQDADAKPGHLPVYVDHDRRLAPVGKLVAWAGDPVSKTIRGVLLVEDDDAIQRVASRELLDVSIEFVPRQMHKDVIDHTVVDRATVYNIALVREGADPDATIHRVMIG